MFPHLTLIGVRRAWSSYFAAACLITLTVLPFTAPFSTCEVAELGGDSSDLDKQPSLKFGGELALVATGTSLPPPLLEVVSLLHLPTTGPTVDRSPLLTALRI